MVVINGEKQADGDGAGAGNYPDVWEELAGDEVFSDDFTSFTGWTTYSGFDTTTTPTIDTAASVYRAKGANPCVDHTLRTNGIVVMPEHTASTFITITRDISGVLDGDGDWTMVAKMLFPINKDQANNSVGGGMLFSLPASNDVRYNSVDMYALEQDVGGVNGIQCQRTDNGTPTNITEANQTIADPTYPHDTWIFMYHKNAVDNVDCFYSIDGGRTIAELGSLTKDTSTFTNLNFVFFGARPAGQVVYSQMELSYVRVYQSLKSR
jgi:hypothetical protein